MALFPGFHSEYFAILWAQNKKLRWQQNILKNLDRLNLKCLFSSIPPAVIEHVLCNFSEPNLYSLINMVILFFFLYCDRQPRPKSPWLCLWCWRMDALLTCLLTQHRPPKRSAICSPTKSNSQTPLAFLSMPPCMKRYAVTPTCCICFYSTVGND